MSTTLSWGVAYLHGPAGVPRPVVPDPVRFAVGAGKPTEVCLTLTAGQFGLLRRSAGERPVAFDTVVAQDREGETVFDRGYYGLYVGPGRVETRPLGASDCEPRLSLTAVTAGEAVRVKVTARPRGRGVTPRRVEGVVRLSATRSDGGVRQLGRSRLRAGEARFATTMPPGRWEVGAKLRIGREGALYGRSRERDDHDQAASRSQAIADRCQRRRKRGWVSCLAAATPGIDVRGLGASRS